MLKPVKIKKFHIKVQRDHETQILEEIGKLGMVQLISERAAIGEEPENIELYNSFMKMYERSTALLSNLQALEYKSLNLLRKPTDKTITSSKELAKSIRTTQGEIKKIVDTYESKLDGLAYKIDLLQKNIEELSIAKDHLLLIKENNIDLTSIDDHVFIFVKVGLINNAFIPKMEEYLKDFRVVYRTKVVRPRESSLIIAAPIEYKYNVEKALALLNFSDFRFPPYLPSDPTAALGEVDKVVVKKLEEIRQLKDLLEGIFQDLEVRREYVNFLREANPSLLRTRSFSVIQGWIPEYGIKSLENKVSQFTDKVLYLNIESPKEDEKVPVELHNKGFLKNFELLTTIRGVPDYKDIDPTLIFALLFPIMYGMMFGDIGDGLLILIWGLLFYKRTKPFLGISRRALNRLGVIMMVGGLSAMIFGVLYGSFFLYEGIKPLLLRPTESFYTVIGISLLFGVIQLILALTLNISNNMLGGDFREAIFGGKGIFGLIYYIIGVILAYRLVLNNFQFSSFLSPESYPLTVIILIMLLLIFLSPTLNGLVSHHLKIGEGLMEGFGEFIETFISYITNSMSYIRLAAFAIAHGVLAQFAFTLGDSLGIIPSLIIVNIMVVFIEGFAAGIQSIRLIFYEFSTKFFKGGGIKFKALKLLLE